MCEQTISKRIECKNLKSTFLVVRQFKRNLAYALYGVLWTSKPNPINGGVVVASFVNKNILDATANPDHLLRIAE